MRFIEEANQLTIKLEGLEQLWALKRRLQIPHFAIEQIDYIVQPPVMKDLWGYWRIPGTALPWRFFAGSYTRKGEREFWYLRMQQPGVLVITIKPDTLNYTKIRITCVPEIAQSIADWWQGKQNKP